MKKYILISLIAVCALIAIGPPQSAHSSSNEIRKLQVALPQREVTVLSSGSQSSLDNGDWVSLGPTNEAGRINSIAPHPTAMGTIYVAADTGGVWKTTNAGLSWVPLTDSMPTLAVGAIAIAPSAPNILYIGTGGRGNPGGGGMGVFKSTDGGASWHAVGDPPFTTGFLGSPIYRISVHPSNPNELVVGTAYGGFRSTDGGTTWTEVIKRETINNVIFTRDVTSIVRHPLDSQVLYATESGPFVNGSCTAEARVLKSTDGGLTWINKSAGLPSQSLSMTIAISPSSPQILYLSTAQSASGGCGAFNVSHVYKSSDGGETWSNLPAVSNNPNFNNLGFWSITNAIVVSPTDPNLVLAGAVGYIRTRDGGVTWDSPPFVGGNMHVDVVDMRYQGNVLYIANDGGVWSTSDSGATSVSRNSGLVTEQYYSVATDDLNRNRILGGTQDQGTNERPDSGGTAWVDVLGGDGGECALDSQSPSFGYLTDMGTFGRMPRLLKLINAGSGPPFNLSSVTPPVGLNETQDISPPLAMDSNNPSILFTAGSRVWKSTDRGDSWIPLSTSTTDGSVWDNSVAISRIAIARSNSSILMVVKANKVFRSVDGGSNWSIASNGLDIPPPTSIEIDPRDPLTAYVTNSGFCCPALHMTTNGGGSWMPRDNGLPTIQVSQFGPRDLAALVVRVDPLDSRILYCGTATGVYSSTDQGANWSRLGNALPNVIVTDMRIFHDGSLMRVATYGRGIWELQLRAAPAPSISSINPPNPTASDQDQDIGVVGSSFHTSLKVNVTFPGGSSVLQGPGQIFNVTSTSFTMRIKLAATGAWTIQAVNTDDGGQSTAFPFTVASPTSCVPLGITAQPLSQTVFVNQTALLTVAVNGTGPFTYQWYKGARSDTSAPINGATVTSYTTQVLSTFDRTTYWVRVKDGCGNAVDSDTARVVTTDKRPLIFVPGIAGSVLVEQGNSELWPGFPCLYDKLTLNPNETQPNIFVSDVVRTVEILGFQVKDVYQTLLSKLVSDAGYRTGNNQTLFLVPYDWRKTNATAVGTLANEVDHVRSLFPGMNVDVLAHSMGGLVAQRYIVDNANSHHINKVITIATPWLGAPKAINVLETGQFLEKWGVAGCTGSIKTLSEYFRGMHELIPSSRYFNLSILPPFREAGWDIDTDGNANQIYDYARLANMLDKRYPVSKPGLSNSSFHNHAGQDDGTLAPADISYFHIYGRQAEAGTIGQVTATTGMACAGLLCVPTKYLEATMTAGDGTVPSVSATRQGRGLSLNEPKHQLFPFVASASSQNAAVEHVGLCSSPPVIAQVISLLSGPNLASADPSQSFQSAGEQSQPAYYLQVIGEPSLTITDGIHTGTITNNSLGLDVPGVNAYIMGNNAFMAVLATSQTYSVTFQTSSQPLTINLTQGTENTTSQAIRYHDLVLPTNISVLLRMTPQGVDSLKYDNDGDGTFETTVAPTASVTGTNAQDIDPPSVAITATPQGNNSLVAITGSDAGSGMKATYYSLDGTNFQTYTGPFTVNPFQGPVVFVFADDNVANRSGLITYYPSNTPNQLGNAQFFVRQHYYDFLSREPDTGGLSFWTNQITSCGFDMPCVENKRINVSAAYFLSIEFQETGYLVYRMYKAAYDNLPSAPVPVRFNEFLPDTQQIGHGVQVGIGNWQTQLENNKVGFALDFVSRSRFTIAYPTTMTPAHFVDALYANAGVAPSAAERTEAINEFGGVGNTADTAARARALRRVAENSTLKQQELNKAFVLMQYFGYLRRNPNDPPEAGLDFAGYNFWLGKLNQFNGNFVNAEMVKAFIVSGEYQQRFGP